MEPASPLLLAAGKHRLLGEVAEILGWTDHTMIETAERLDSSAADRMRRSTTVPAAVAYWSYAIKNRQNIPSELGRLVDLAAKERNRIAIDRDDFIHALFTGKFAAVLGHMAPGYQTTTVAGISTGATRSTSEIQELRDRAAMLSCLVVAHIDHCMNPMIRHHGSTGSDHFFEVISLAECVNEQQACSPAASCPFLPGV